MTVPGEHVGTLLSMGVIELVEGGEAVFMLFYKVSLLLSCGVFTLPLVVQHKMWSPHIARTSNAIHTNITKLLESYHLLYGPSLNQHYQLRLENSIHTLTLSRNN